MSFLEILPLASTGIFLAIPALMLPFLYIYLVHDYAGRRQGDRDPLLGAKVFSTLIMTVAAQLALAGVATVAAAVAGGGPKEFAVKTGAAMALAGIIVGAFPAYLYFARVRTAGGARIGHQALGLNALFAGVAFAIAVVVGCQALFHGEKAAEVVAIALIYGAAMIGCGLGLQRGPIPSARIQT